MSDNTVRQFRYLPMDVVHHGSGALGQLAGELTRAGMQRAFVVTSASVAKRTDVVDRIRAQLGDALAGVFTGVQPHVPYGCLQPGLDLLRQAGPVLLVSVGGGSTVDAARALALAVGEGMAHVRELETLRAQFTPPADPVIPATSGNALPHVAVPLTLSAAEFANAGAVTSETRHEKDLLIADELTPRAVILDPEAAVQTPVELWVATGMRALDHAIETVYSPRRGPVTDALSLAAIERLAPALRAAWRDPADVAAREQGQIAAWMSYFGEMNLTLGLSHAIGHQLGAQFGIQHGVTSCIVLPQVMRYLAPVVADRLALVAAALGVDTAGLSADAAAEAAAVAVEQLVKEFGLPNSLSQVGV
ncbi:MAG TPA: iron-containing alcohol dehydrogenase, partial [Chloroflexota bacterium]|nr:iron-containing alcohol dehydrogenase [Chloroflexota bacterium]